MKYLVRFLCAALFFTAKVGAMDPEPQKITFILLPLPLSPAALQKCTHFQQNVLLNLRSMFPPNPQEPDKGKKPLAETSLQKLEEAVEFSRFNPEVYNIGKTTITEAKKIFFEHFKEEYNPKKHT